MGHAKLRLLSSILSLLVNAAHGQGSVPAVGSCFSTTEWADVPAAQWGTKPADELPLGFRSATIEVEEMEYPCIVVKNTLGKAYDVMVETTLPAPICVRNTGAFQLAEQCDDSKVRLCFANNGQAGDPEDVTLQFYCADSCPEEGFINFNYRVRLHDGPIGDQEIDEWCQEFEDPLDFPSSLQGSELPPGIPFPTGTYPPGPSGNQSTSTSVALPLGVMGGLLVVCAGLCAFGAVHRKKQTRSQAGGGLAGKDSLDALVLTAGAAGEAAMPDGEGSAIDSLAMALHDNKDP